MRPFVGRAIGLGFAELWLLAGAGALAAPWHMLVAVAGTIAIAALTVNAWRMHERRDGLFRMRRYWIAVAAEIAALALAQWLLHRWRIDGYLLPVVGTIVGLHFVGLWWAVGGATYLWLAAVMTAVNLIALLLPPGGDAMQAVSGLGSAAALAGFAGLGPRR